MFTKYRQSHDFGGRRVLNLGCGFAKFTSPRVVNVDMFDNCAPDVVHDLSDPLPFKDCEFDFIIANHIFEHVPNWWDCFKDCCRVLKPGGQMEVWVPGDGGDAVLGFRDHVNTINRCSWYGIKDFVRAATNAWAIEHNSGPTTKVKMIRQLYHMVDRWWIMVAPNFLKAWFAEHLRNTVFEVGYFLEKEA